MALDVRQDTALAVVLVPAEVWTTPVAAVRSPSGELLESPTATQDTTSTTISSAANPYQLVLASITGVDPGDHLLITHDGEAAARQVATVDTSALTVSLKDPLPWTPEAADTVEGLDIRLTVAAAYTDTRGPHYSVTVTDSTDASRELRETFHVVRRKFLAPVTAADVNAIMTRTWPGNLLSVVLAEEIAADAHDEIRDELLASGEYAEIYLDPDPFRPVGKLIVRRILATQWGLVPPGNDTDEYIRRMERRISEKMGSVMASLQARDADDDNKADEGSALRMAQRWSR